VRRLLAALIALVALLVAARSARADVARPVHGRRLANGLRVVVSPDPSAAEVSIVVRYDAGARDEPDGRDGLAHLVEHLMFTGSKHVPRGKLAELLEQAGATSVNGVTSADDTIYLETLPPERLELGLWLESDRMGYLLDRADEAAFERARAEVINEHHDSVLEQPLGNVPGFLHAELFPAWHPYHHLTGGTAATLRALTLADARSFVGTWYGPGNAVVAIAGKVDPVAAIALVERYFGTLPARPPPARPALPALPRRPTRTLTVGASVTRAEVDVAWITPPLGAPGDAELDLAAALLAGDGTGWLERALLGPPRLCSSVRAAQRSSAAASVFQISAVAVEGHSLNEVLVAVQRAMGRFDNAMGADLQRVKTAFYNRKLFALDSTLAWAAALAMEPPPGPFPARFDAHLARYAGITPDDVRQAVRAHLGRLPAVFVLSGATPGMPVAGKLLDARVWSP